MYCRIVSLTATARVSSAVSVLQVARHMNVISMMRVDLFTLGDFEQTLQLVRLGNPRLQDVGFQTVLRKKSIILNLFRVISFLFYSFLPEWPMRKQEDAFRGEWRHFLYVVSFWSFFSLQQ